MKNKKIVMIPGPTPVLRSIQNQMGREICSFKDPEFIDDFKELIADLKEVFEVEGEVFVVAGTGTMAMEMAVANVTKENDNILVVSNGYFGDRFVELCERKRLNVDVLSAEWGSRVSLEEIEEKLKSKNYKAITVTHVDTSTGVAAQIEEIGELLKKYEDTIYIVDGVCATAGEKEYMTRFNIDVLFTGSQKAFGVSPGLAILFAGEKALKRRKELGTIKEYYIDFDKWLPIMKDPTKYFGTPPINLIWALKESVKVIKEEGIENRYKRHIKDAEYIQNKLIDMGFDILAKEDCRAATLSNVVYPKNIKDAEFRSVLAEEGIVVAGGLGPYAGKLFRLGHMGNIDQHIIYSTLGAIERTISKISE